MCSHHPWVVVGNAGLDKAPPASWPINRRGSMLKTAIATRRPPAGTMRSASDLSLPHIQRQLSKNAMPRPLTPGLPGAAPHASGVSGHNSATAIRRMGNNPCTTPFALTVSCAHATSALMSPLPAPPTRGDELWPLTQRMTASRAVGSDTATAVQPQAGTRLHSMLKAAATASA